MNAPPTFDLAAITGIVQKGLDSRQRELDFRIVVGQLHTYITAHAPDAESLEACVAHANQGLGEWPAVTRVAEKRWWMIIEETEIVNDWDTGELFRGWRIPPDWRATMQRLECAALHAGHRYNSDWAMQAVAAEGVPLLCYTVNDAARARTLFDLGIASLFSDAPDRTWPAAQ